MRRRMATSARPQRVRLLGGEVDLITPWDVMRHIDGAVARCGAGGRHTPALITNHNAHSLFLVRRSAKLRARVMASISSSISRAPSLWLSIL